MSQRSMLLRSTRWTPTRTFTLYRCKDCEKRFGWSSQLRKHLLIHTGEVGEKGLGQTSQIRKQRSASVVSSGQYGLRSRTTTLKTQQCTNSKEKRCIRVTGKKKTKEVTDDQLQLTDRIHNDSFSDEESFELRLSDSPESDDSEYVPPPINRKCSTLRDQNL